MNKKLFALLASAAVVAGTCPAVFADAAAPTATIKFVADKETVKPGEDVNFDVYVAGDVTVTTLQFTLDATGGTIATDIQKNAKTGNNEDLAFKWDEDSSDLLQWGKKNRGYIGATLADMTEEQLKPFNGSAKDYMVLGYDVDQAGANPATEGTDGQIKIGSIAVKAGESGEVSMTSNFILANYLGGQVGDATRDVLNANTVAESATVKIDANASTESSDVAAPESSSAAPVADSSSAAPVADSSSAAAKPAVSSTAATTDSSSKAATNNNGTTKSTSSTAKTNNANDNKNTGAASTAAVALVGAAAALVVVSKKRK